MIIGGVHIVLDATDKTRPPTRWTASIDQMPFADIYWIEDKGKPVISVYDRCLKAKTPNPSTDPAGPICNKICQALTFMRSRVDTTHCTLTIDGPLVYQAIDLPGV